MSNNYTTTWVDFENEYRDRDSSLIVELKTNKFSTSREIELQDILYKIWTKRDNVDFKDIENLRNFLNEIGKSKFEF